MNTSDPTIRARAVEAACAAFRRSPSPMAQLDALIDATERALTLERALAVTAARLADALANPRARRRHL